MGSFALYYSKNADGENNGDKQEKIKLSADIHFNLWNISHDDQQFLDIGIMLHHLSKNQSVFLYIPFSVDQSDISDLGSLLSTDKRLLAAIFNENYSLLQSSKPKWADVLKTDTSNSSNSSDSSKVETAFSIFTLDIGSNLVAEPLNEDGTKIKIMIPVASSGEPYPNENIYIRFRVKTSKIQENLIRSYKNAISLLTGLVKERYVVDFRYNDTRSFNDKELEEFTTEGKNFVATKKLHFLLLCKAYVDVECSSDVKKREIEKGVWQGYVKTGGVTDTDDIIAYHASKKIAQKDEVKEEGKTKEGDKEDKDIGSWEFFAKQNVDFINKKRAFKLFILMIIVGALINGIYDIVKPCFLGLINLILSII